MPWALVIFLIAVIFVNSLFYFLENIQETHKENEYTQMILKCDGNIDCINKTEQVIKMLKENKFD